MGPEMTLIKPPSRTDEQRKEALKIANKQRVARHKLRQQVRSGRESAAALIADPPEIIHNLTIAEVLSWSRADGMRAVGMRQIGARAVRDGINLFIPLGMASVRTKAWAVSEGLRYVHGEESRRAA